MIVRARTVVPMARDPFDDGAVVVARGRIQAVGSWRRLGRSGRRREVVDLGEVALLPGLVNAHCHLDYTAMAGQLVPQRSFTDWIKSITELKLGWGRTDFLESWKQGAEMLVRSGTTTVGDTEAMFDLLPDVWRSTPLRVRSFLEMTGVRSRRQPERIVAEAVGKVRSLPSGRSRAWLSPHAPYSTTPRLLQLSGEVSRRRGWPLSIHVAESEEEMAMFGKRRGPLFKWLARNERDMTDCGGTTPVMHLERHGVLGPWLLAIHVNYLKRGEAALLGERGVHVVHCPRSHRYFGHAPFPWAQLTRAGVNVCLGSDSLATVVKRRCDHVELDLFAEMRAFAEAAPAVPPLRVLSMVTVNAARALGMAGQVGELSPGAAADLVAIPYAGMLSAVGEAVLQHAGPVAVSMIGGQRVRG